MNEIEMIKFARAFGEAARKSKDDIVDKALPHLTMEEREPYKRVAPIHISICKRPT